MQFTDREAKILKDAMDPVNKYMEPVEDFKLEGMYEFKNKTADTIRHINAFCASNELEARIYTNMEMNFAPTLQVMYTKNSEFLMLKELDNG